MAMQADEEALLRPVQKQRRFGTLRAISALILREMGSSYGRSPGGYIWALLEPIAGIAMLSVVFALFLRSPPLGTNFAIFYATGMVPFVAFQSVSGKVQQAILYSRPLLVYPSVTYVDAIIARFLLNFATEILVAYLVFSGIRTIWETRTVVDLPTVALGYAMVAALCFGVGLMNCFLTSMFPLWQKVWGVVTRPLMLLSCIFYLYDTIPEPAHSILWYNPLIHVVGQVRSGFYATYDAPYVSYIYVFGLSAVLSVLALIFLGRYHREILTR